MSGGETNQQRFERMGASQVRMFLNTNSLPQPMILDAANWLAQLDEEERSRRESSQTEQTEIARSAKDAAWAAARAAERAATAAEMANKRAMLAMAIAVIGIIIAIVSAWTVHRDAMLTSNLGTEPSSTAPALPRQR